MKTTISGKAGEGKTTLGLKLAMFLEQALGYEVILQDDPENLKLLFPEVVRQNRQLKRVNKTIILVDCDSNTAGGNVTWDLTKLSDLKELNKKI
jgi:MinD superfamily P-loop ATPase